MPPKTRLRYRLPRNDLVRLALPDIEPHLEAEGVTLVREEMGQGTFPKEKVTVRAMGREIALLMKYDHGVDHYAHGHRGGLGYEAHIYDTILRDSGMTAPGLVGVGPGEADSTWLAVEYLTDGVRLKHALDESAMARAAEWAGRFHRHGERIVPENGATLRRSDRAYYEGWAARTVEKFAESAPPWLHELCRVYTANIDWILSWPLTVIHGEYYPNNIMWRDGTVYPVDWESAAVAFGEIDVASLSEGWSADTVASITSAYAEARWPGAPAPVDHQARLDAARLYLQLRWLAEYDLDRFPPWRLDLLRRSGERLGWL